MLSCYFIIYIGKKLSFFADRTVFFFHRPSVLFTKTSPGTKKKTLPLPKKAYRPGMQQNSVKILTREK